MFGTDGNEVMDKNGHFLYSYLDRLNSRLDLSIFSTIGVLCSSADVAMSHDSPNSQLR